MPFEQMNLMEPLLAAVKACGYDEPTPIQYETIPPVLEGRDVLGCAQTGTGKTAAFALPILQRLHTERKQHTGKRTIRALILTPTRELAMQIFENFAAYGKGLPLRSCVIFGGVPQRAQTDQLGRGVDILVATPGRLNDLIGQGFISLSHLEIFVLDEADRMLDMGFIHDVRKVIALLPEKRQTLLFSATMPGEVEKLAMGILKQPVTVKVDPVSSTVDAIDQYLYTVDKCNKKLLLASLLRTQEVESALVFTRTKHGADRVVRELESAHINAKAIHGDKSQSARQQALSEFKAGKIAVLIATDIAARGIDIAGLSHVFNYDLPNEPEAYIHRIGRTGRAGLNGTAISFCCIDEMKDLREIEKLIGKKIPRLESAWPMQVFTETVKQPRSPRPSRQDAPPRQSGFARTGASSAREARPMHGARAGRDAAPEREARPMRGAAPEREARPMRGAVPARDARPMRGAAPEREARPMRGAAPEREARPMHSPRANRDAQPAREARPMRGANSASAPAMRATPLERPLHAAPVRHAQRADETFRKEPQREFAPATSGREPAPQPTAAHKPAKPHKLFTGHDRW
ncbi:MAG: DEAD/DEAH box helicase [Clostridia bacterium]